MPRFTRRQFVTPPALAEPNEAPLPPPTNDAERRAARERILARRIPMDQGSIFIGTEGMMHLPHVSAPRLFPTEKFKDHALPDIASTHHWTDWAEACVGRSVQPLAPFDYSGPLTEAVLLGSVAVRFPHTTLEWNSDALRFENVREANAYVRREYRPGWQVAGL